jgi:hypothetical protein
METKMMLHGAGVYYFALSGARSQGIFQSVFEYDYGIRLLAELRGCRLLAYVLDENSIRCVMRCDRDWTEVLEDIQVAFNQLHERCWQQTKPVLSEQGIVLLVDEQAYLTDLIIQMHRLPQTQRLVADASVYPWSSDHHYRDLNPPKWIDTQSMLNLLCQTRHNTATRYQAVMEQPHVVELDLEHGCHPLYQALARDHFINQHQARNAVTGVSRTPEELQRLLNDACDLIAGRFSLTRDELLDRTLRRQYARLMPLVVWLLSERGLTHETIANLIKEDEEVLPLWIRSVPADHPDTLLAKLKALWSPDLASLQLASSNGKAKPVKSAVKPAAIKASTDNDDSAPLANV